MGYASEKLISFIEDELHAGYLFRLHTKFNCEIDALPVPSDQAEIVDRVIMLNGRKVRILRFFLKSGVLKTLITNDFSLDKEMFRMCYFLRCPVEENYKLIKGNAGLTSGEVCPFLSTLDSFLWSAQSAVCYFACISFKHTKLLTLLINDKINPALCFAV